MVSPSPYLCLLVGPATGMFQGAKDVSKKEKQEQDDIGNPGSALCRTPAFLRRSFHWKERALLKNLIIVAMQPWNRATGISRFAGKEAGSAPGPASARQRCLVCNAI